jgi:hypothetical protein
LHHTIRRTRAATVLPSVIGGPGSDFIAADHLPIRTDPGCRSLDLRRAGEGAPAASHAGGPPTRAAAQRQSGHGVDGAIDYHRARQSHRSQWPCDSDLGASGATTWTSSSRWRSAAAALSPIKLAPTTTARLPFRARVISSRLSASDRNVRTCGSSARQLQPDRLGAGGEQQLVKAERLASA